jgi:hypothetical protein
MEQLAFTRRKRCASMETRHKDFDCVDMKRQADLRIFSQLEGKSREEQLEYWRKQHELFLAEYPQMRPEINTDIDPAKRW